MVLVVIYYILLAFLVCLWARVILSYFPLTPGTPAFGLSRIVGAVVDPVLTPVRKVVPAVRLGAGALDLSPIIVSIVVIILLRFL